MTKIHHFYWKISCSNIVKRRVNTIVRTILAGGWPSAVFSIFRFFFTGAQKFLIGPKQSEPGLIMTDSGDWWLIYWFHGCAVTKSHAITSEIWLTLPTKEVATSNCRKTLKIVICTRPPGTKDAVKNRLWKREEKQWNTGYIQTTSIMSYFPIWDVTW